MVPNVRGSGGGRLIEHQKPNQPVNLELVDGSEWFLGKLRDFINSYTDSLSRTWGHAFEAVLLTNYFGRQYHKNKKC